MRPLKLIIFAFLMVGEIHAQDATNNSFFQMVAKWGKDEKQTYKVTDEFYNLKPPETIPLEIYTYTYEVDVTVIDSTANSYTINWFYHDYDFNGSKAIRTFFSGIKTGLTVTLHTDRFGALTEIANWQEIKDQIYQNTELIHLLDPINSELDEIIKNVKETYSTKENMQANCFNEIMKFYLFNTTSFKSEFENTTRIKVTNPYTGTPMDASQQFSAKKFNLDDGVVTLSLHTGYDSEQLTKTKFDYLTSESEKMNTPRPNWASFPKDDIQEMTISTIHFSGWPMRIVDERQVYSASISKVVKTTIELNLGFK